MLVSRRASLEQEMAATAASPLFPLATKMAGMGARRTGSRPLPPCGLWDSYISAVLWDAGNADAPSPRWERALSLNEPQASLEKEGEGPAPLRVNSWNHG